MRRQRDEPSCFVFQRRRLPSANSVLVLGNRPILVDSGFGTQTAETVSLMRQAGCEPEQLKLLVNTHYHCDHTGGNAYLQHCFRLSIAAHASDALAINSRDPEICAASWLRQPIAPYWVDRPLADQQELDTSRRRLRVLHTPGHTRGHIALWSPEDRVLICGDILAADDVGWLNPYREGSDALNHAIVSLERLDGLGARVALPGHGQRIDDPAKAIARAHSRLTQWLNDPETMAWHALKRAFAYALIMRPLAVTEVDAYLVAAPWFCDIARQGLGVEPEQFVAAFLRTMLRSGGIVERGRVLRATHEHSPPGRHARRPVEPIDWPDAPEAVQT